MRKPRISRRGLALVGLPTSLAIAAYGQHIIDDRGDLAEGWPLVSAFDSKLTELYRTEQSAALAILLFFVAMVLFVLSLRTLLRGSETDEAVEAGGSSDGAPWLPRRRRYAALILLVGLASLGVWAFLIWKLAHDRYESYYPHLFFGSLLALAAALLVIDTSRGAKLKSTVRFRRWEVGLVAGLAGLFIGLMVHDLTDWRYAYIGDDGEFWRVAKEIAKGTNEYNLLGQRGPYAYHPPMSSAYQAAVMRMAGVDIFGWKLASVLAVAFTLPVFYWLMRTMFGSRTAAYATAILAFSHYLFGYAHTGYNNIFPLFPTVLAFALFFAGRRSSSMLLIFGSGAVAGLGFYTFYSARSIIIILALAVLFMGYRRWRRDLLVPLGAGFALAVAPIFASEGWDVIESMRGQSASSERTPIEMVSRLLESAPRVILAFNFNPFRKHFVYGSLLDELSAVLALLGMGYAAYRVRREEHRFLVIWYLVAMVVTGLFHPRQDEINSRLHYVLPPMAAFAGLALDRIVAGFSKVSSSPRLERILAVAAFAVVMPAVLGFNVHRFWVESPPKFQASVSSVAFREVSSPSCDIEGYHSIIFARETAPGLPYVFDFYGWSERMPLLFRFDASPDEYEREITREDVSCILVTSPEREESQPIMERIEELARETGNTVEKVTDLSERTEVLVLRLAHTSDN